MSTLAKVTTENFDEEVLASETPVVLDFWGPQCVPCIQLDPHMEELNEEFAGRVKLAKVIAPENRPLSIRLKVMGLPAFLAFKDGEEVARISGDLDLRQVRELIESLAG